MKKKPITPLIALLLPLLAGCGMEPVTLDGGAKEREAATSWISDLRSARIDREGHSWVVFVLPPSFGSDSRCMSVQHDPDCACLAARAAEGGPTASPAPSPAAGPIAEDQGTEVFVTPRETYVVGTAWEVRDYLADNGRPGYQGLFAVTRDGGRPARLPILDRRGLERLRRQHPEGVPSPEAMLLHDQTENLFYAILNR